jgi:hypothetical protein
MNLRVGYAVLVAGMVIAAFAGGCTYGSTPSTPTPTPTPSGSTIPDTLWVQDATTRTVRVYPGASLANGGINATVALPTNDNANPDVVYDPTSDTLWYPNQTNPAPPPNTIDIWTMASTRNNVLSTFVIGPNANTQNLMGAAVFDRAHNLLLVAKNTSNTIDVYTNATAMNAASLPAGHVTLTGINRPQEMLYDSARDILFVADSTTFCAKFNSFFTSAASLAVGGATIPINQTTSITGLGLGNGAGMAYNSVQDILFITEVSPPQINIIKTASTFNSATTHAQTLNNFAQPKGLAYDGVRDILYVYDSNIFVFPNATTASGSQLSWPNRRVIFDAATALSGFGIFVDTTH